MSISPSNYNTQAGGKAETESPYVRGMAISDRRLGLLRTGFRVMLGLSAILVATNLFLGYALINVTREKQVEIYVVEVDDTGRPVEIDLADRDYEPTEGMIQRSIADLVTRIRSKPSDPIFLRQQWADVYKQLVGDAAGTMNNFGRPRAREKALYVATIISVVRQTPETIQVNWNEQRIENGTVTRTTRWTGIFTYTIKPPTTAAEAFDNPLGLFVNSMSWSPELETPQS